VFLERGEPAPIQPARGLPQWGWGGAPAEIEFGAF